MNCREDSQVTQAAAVTKRRIAPALSQRVYPSRESEWLYASAFSGNNPRVRALSLQNVHRPGHFSVYGVIQGCDLLIAVNPGLYLYVRVIQPGSKLAYYVAVSDLGRGAIGEVGRLNVRSELRKALVVK